MTREIPPGRVAEIELSSEMAEETILMSTCGRITANFEGWLELIELGTTKTLCKLNIGRNASEILTLSPTLSL